MRVPIRTVLVGLALLSASIVHAQDPNPLTAVKADRWADAQAAAARYADPVAEKLVLYLRLRAPGAATASEISDFLQRNPDWPAPAMLERRRQEAIASDPDDAAVLAQCSSVPTLASAMLRCAEATANAGRTGEADALARQAWVSAVDSATGEAAFMRRWGGIATADDQWARFQRLAWLSDASDAARQITRLDSTHHAAAEARLAAKRADPQTEALVSALPAALQADPGLILDRARGMRRANRAADAASLLVRTSDSANPSVFWSERNLLARKLLHDGDAKSAYAVVAANTQTADEPRAEANFLAGFIALRMLHDPATAEKHFQSLANSHAAITQSRAHYWLARSATAAGKDARPEYEKAAAWPTTFYGQLATLALGDQPAARIAKLHDPAWTQETALAFTGHEVVRAAAWLVAWGDPQRARAFLTRMDELAPIPAERALTAAFGLYVGLPDAAVFVARRMGRDGIALPHLGWPTPYSLAAPPDPAFSLGIMRQESSFDVGAVSSSGARGLMQLMPPTATAVAKQLGILASVPTLTVDASHNIRLGTAYLQEVLTRFDNCLPLAAAAYNAGPHRVAEWLSDNGDPRTGPIDMVDWIELIPGNETRNYVQRVTENVVMYRAIRNDPAPILQAVDGDCDLSDAGSMDSISHRISAWDGLDICVREWSDGDRLPPVLCLPGLVRTALDFETLAPAIGAGRRVVAIDYPGRGDSGRSNDIARYAPEACARDVIDACAALGIRDAVVIGTSFGGLLAMGLAAARPALVRGVVLNDIGPDVGAEGADFVRDFIGNDPALECLEACANFLRERLPPLSLDTDEAWRRMAELTYQPGPDGRWHPVWDIRIARLLNDPPPDLWLLFGALAYVPVLLVRGEVSNILLPSTVARMQAMRPDMEVVTVPDIGHAPILTEPEALAAIQRFLRPEKLEPKRLGLAETVRLQLTRLKLARSQLSRLRPASLRPSGLRPGSLRLARLKLPRLNVARFIASGFGLGCAPVAAGTVASLAAVLAGAVMLAVSPPLLLLAAALATFGGYAAVKRAGIVGDPGWVVIDEFAGQWITLLALAAPSVPGLLAAFLLFRLFDITKLGPVGWADRRHGAFGIMADDVIAGMIAGALLMVLRLLRPSWL